MPPAILGLRRSDSPRRAATAVLLGDEDPAAWLAELTARGPALGQLGLYRVPAAGLLAVGAAGARGLAFGWLGRHLLLPLDAELHPPISADEADRLFSRWHLVLWHPTLGPCGFDRAEAVPLADLLAPSQDRRPGTWNAALPGTPLPPPLRLIQLPLPVQAGEIFGDAAKQIGNDPIKPPKGSTPPPAESAGQGAAGGSNALGNALKALGGFFGGGGGRQPGWMDKLDGWLSRQLGPPPARPDLEALRQKEIDRLLRELAENPDRGLRHAIPLGSLPGAEGRGVAPPSWQLGLRKTDFALDALFASGAADAWSLDASRQNLLRQRYHELARREIQLGRHRRAAYIYAQLLRDLHSAATTLLAGGHHREAAVLYLDHLRNPAQAARALIEGGFYEEALPVLESVPDWRGVARVQRLRGDEAAAKLALRREAERLIKSQSRIAGATVLEKEVEVPREAAEVLAAAWPFGNDAFECLTELFALHHRQQWAEDARALLAKLRDQPLSDAQAVVLAKALSRVYTRLSSAPWRALAADVAQVRIGRHLAEATPKDRRALAECLPKLVAGDRLIGRDVQRYLGFPRQSGLDSVKSISRGTWRVEKVRVIRPNPSMQVLTAASWGEGYVLFGHNEAGHLEIRVGQWEGPVSMLSWPNRKMAIAPQLATAILQSGAPIVVLPQPSDIRPTYYQESTFKHKVGTPPWLPPEALAVAYQNSEILVARAGEERCLAYYSVSGVLAGTHPLPEYPWRGAQGFHLAGHPSGHCAFGVDGQLLIVHRPGQASPTALDLEFDIIGLRSAFRFARAGFAVVVEGAAHLWWSGLKRTVHVANERDGGHYQAEFTAGANLLLVDDLGGQLFDLDLRGEASLRAEFDLPPSVALSPGPGRDEFAVYGRDGNVTIYRNAR